MKSLGALANNGRSTWGRDFLAIKKIFKAVMIPQIICGVLIWHILTTEKEH